MKFGKNLKDRYRYSLILLRQLVITDFKLRYQGSVLGYAWSLLKPLLLFVILYTVFVKFLRIGGDMPHFPIYLLLGIVLWNFFTETTGQSLESIVGRGDLIRKIRIPRWTIVMSSSLSALINLGLNLLVVLAFMIITDVDFMKDAVWFPVILGEIYIFALGVSLYLAAAFVRYRDISYIWDVITQAFFYLTPILYPLSVITDNMLQRVIMLNPMAQTIQDARNVLITKETLTIAEVYGSVLARLITVVIVLTFFFIGFWYFRREAKHFAENI